MAVQDLERIEQKIDRAAAGAIAVSDNVGGIAFTSMSEVLEFAKLMSIAGTAVPKHLRGNPGQCLAVTIQALEWRSSPFSVANKSYEVNDRIAYESQLIHAVIEARAPLKGRLRGAYKGEGITRQLTITGHMKGEVDALEYESPEIGKIKVKNSPLWTADPDQQLWYYATRSWARRYCPDVLLGIYSVDEMEEGKDIHDVTPKPDVGARLKGSKGRGFSAEHVDAQTKASDQKPDKPVAEVLPPDGAAQLDLAHDVENEMASKRKAVDSAETLDDLKAIVGATTEYLKEAKRQDLLSDFLSLASAREKKITPKDSAAKV